MQRLVRHMFVTALLLGGFALVGTGLVAVTFDMTDEQIAENERLTLIRALNAIVPSSLYDNELSADVIEVNSREWLGDKKPVKIYRAFKKDRPAAAVLTPVAPDGYNGAIHLMVAVKYDGTVLGVRVLAHRETPGLGDAIDISRTPWVHRFEGRSLRDPDEVGWNVVKDGGVFDQFTGATITPRAVVRAIHAALVYYDRHRSELFRPGSGPGETQ